MDNSTSLQQVFRKSGFSSINPGETNFENTQDSILETRLEDESFHKNPDIIWAAGAHQELHTIIIEELSHTATPKMENTIPPPKIAPLKMKKVVSSENHT